MAITIEQGRAAKAAAKTALAHLPGIVGIGLTMLGEDYALKVNLREALPPNLQLPDRIQGVQVCAEVVGTIRKHE